jgi:hypothetical protein
MESNVREKTYMKKTISDLINTSFVLAVVFAGIFTVSVSAQTFNSTPYQMTQIAYPENGENLLGSSYNQITGRHSIVVRNNSGFDAIVKLEDYNTEETYRLVFVRRNQSYTISDIRDGLFMIKFALGSDYSSAQRMFLKPSGFTKFDNPNRFQETRSSDGYRTTVRYSQLSITLAPVVDGNAQTSKISARDF